MELSEDTSYGQLMPGILRGLWDLAETENQGTAPEAVKLYLGREHPAYRPIMNTTRLRRGEMQCLYIRVADMAGFLRHITPALEKKPGGLPNPRLHRYATGNHVQERP